MASNGSAEHLVHTLKESLRNLESLQSLTDEQEVWVKKIMQHIRTKIAELKGD
jgi:hypothetical protein